MWSWVSAGAGYLMVHVWLGSVPSRWRVRAKRLVQLGAIALTGVMVSTGLVVLVASAAQAAVTGGAGASLAYTESLCIVTAIGQAAGVDVEVTALA
jgi:hypothetical protein